MKKSMFLLSAALTAAITQAGVPRVQVKNWGPKYEAVKQLYGQAVADRSNLASLRERHMAEFSKEEQKLNPDYLSLTPAITDDTIEYIKNMVDQIIQKLGPPPTKFSLFTMGSMAREESGFYTDLEVGLLVDQKNLEVKTYFDKFAQLLADRLFLLGEHPAVQGKGLRIDEADNAPVHMRWFARYASPAQAQEILEATFQTRNKELTPTEGTRVFLATPEEFAGYLDPLISEKIEEEQKAYVEKMRSLVRDALEKELEKPVKKRRSREEVTQEVRAKYSALLRPASGREKGVLASLIDLMRNLRHLYGDKEIFDRFIAESERYLDGPPSENNPHYKTRRQEIVFKALKTNITKFLEDPAALVHGNLDDDLDIKRKLYRWPEQVLTNLGFWYHLDTQNGEEILQKLVSDGLFNPQLAEQTRDLLNFATGLRLKEQVILRKQGKTVPLTQEEWTKGKKSLEEELAFQKENEKFLIQTLPAIEGPEAAQTIKAMDAAHAKVLELQVELASYDKLKPLEPGSIIEAQDVEWLKNKYLPILRDLFKRAQAFVLGDREAFIRPPENAPETSKTTGASIFKAGLLKKITEGEESSDPSEKALAERIKQLLKMGGIE